MGVARKTTRGAGRIPRPPAPRPPARLLPQPRRTSNTPMKMSDPNVSRAISLKAACDRLGISYWTGKRYVAAEWKAAVVAKGGFEEVTT
jgi:hypothetical protein